MRNILIYVAIIFLFTGLYFSQRQVESNRKLTALGKELLYVPNEKILHGLTLGDDPTAADLLWLRTIFYIANFHDEACNQCGYLHEDDIPHFGSHSDESDLPDNHDEANFETGTGSRDPGLFYKTDFRRKREVGNLLFGNINSDYARYLHRLLDATTNLDPLFATPYFEGAMNLGLNFGRYDEALSLLEKGMKVLPDRWEMLYYRGFIRLFYLNDKKNAALDLRAAGLKPNAPVIVIQQAAAIQVGAGLTDMALDFLQTLFEITEDEYLKDKIEDMLAVYGEGKKTAPVKQKKSVSDLLDSLSIEL